MNDKTIRMPKKLLAKWLKALRKGGYAQTKGELYDPETCGFCCLGVLQHTASRGSVEVYDSGSFRALPTDEWLWSQGIVFLDETGATDQQPFLPSLRCTAAEANDLRGLSFREIADAIEDCAEGV